MMQSSVPVTKDLVLVGGGHTHALVLKAWAMRPLPGARVTLVNPAPVAAYSGMLPGFVAGHYAREDLKIDLVRLAHRAGARFVVGAASGVDRARQELILPDHPPIGYDVLSLDIGITSAMPLLPGFAEFGTPAKPLDRFASAWAGFRNGEGPAEVVVLGGGVAGAELAMAMAHWLRVRGRSFQITLIDRGQALSALRPRAAQRLRAHLADQGVRLLEGQAPSEVRAHEVLLESGTTIPSQFTVGAAGALPYAWLEKTGLCDDAGFVAVDAQLRSRDPAIFAVGDCAEMTSAPRPKAGVYAVRQAPVLLHNLKAALAETGGLKPYRPQSDYLKLISLGARSAQGERFGQTFSGPWVWRLKDRIDRQFMDAFAQIPQPILPPLPWPRAAGGDVRPNGQQPCGGCGAKIGQTALQGVLSPGDPGDDAGVLRQKDGWQVISTDHLRAFIEDPVRMTRIAALHALGDIWAMGAAPQVALASITLPQQAQALAGRHLAEIMATARAVMAEAGADVIGGHSTLGAEMSIGFTVTGLSENPPIGLAGARPGDSLILTRPLGSGVILAAHMQGTARGETVFAALAEMSRPQGAAARLLKDAHAMTDVTGFGLAGHLRNICTASGVGARMHLADVPLMEGALALSETGVRSTLYPENRKGFDLPEDPRAALLFDPQTSGGLLAAVDAPPDAFCAKLQAAGFMAASIGEITEARGQIEIV